MTVQEITPIVADVQSLVITNADLRAKATTKLTTIKQLMKDVEAERKATLKPLDEHRKIINDKYKGILEPLKDAEQTIKSQMLCYDQRIIRERQEENRRLLEEDRKAVAMAEEAKRLAEQGDIDEAIDLDFEAKEIAEKAHYTNPDLMQSTKESIVTTWDFVIEDEDLIPREYMIPDVKAIRAVVKAQKERCKIAGIKTIQKKSVRV